MKSKDMNRIITDIEGDRYWIRFRLEGPEYKSVYVIYKDNGRGIKPIFEGNKEDCLEYFNSIEESKAKLNFNQILWEAPMYDEVPGFLPSDKFYEEICDWLKSMKDVHRYKVDSETHVMKEMPDSEYNVVASFNHETKMIHYHFQRKFEYFI